MSRGAARGEGRDGQRSEQGLVVVLDANVSTAVSAEEERLALSMSSSTSQYARSVSRSSSAILQRRSSRRAASSGVPPSALLVRTRPRSSLSPSSAPRRSSSSSVAGPTLLRRLSGLRTADPDAPRGIANAW